MLCSVRVSAHKMAEQQKLEEGKRTSFVWLESAMEGTSRCWGAHRREVNWPFGITRSFPLRLCTLTLEDDSGFGDENHKPGCAESLGK